MISVTQDWNPKQKELKQLLANKDDSNAAIQLCLRMHSELHDSKVGGIQRSYQDELINDLSDIGFKYKPKGSFNTIAWCLWHITRIEDAITNVLIVDNQQVLDEEILDKIGSPIKDTGNALLENEVVTLSNKIHMNELLNYRYKVGERTRKILRQLSKDDLARKPNKKQLTRLIDEGVVSDKPGSIWLVDFWSKKTIAGFLTLPITRHQIVHINECMKIKVKFMKERRANGSI